MAKSYREYCPIAHALDLVGERWSLLVVRELQHGPLRYSDLHERISGCSTNMLAARLRDLEEAGVVCRRRLEPPAAATVYELTPVGEGLRGVLAALAHWGLRTLGPPPANVALSSGWLERALWTSVVALAPEARVTFRVGDETASLAGGTVVAGELPGADAIVECDPPGLYALLVEGDLDRSEIAGSRTAVEHVVAAVAAGGAVTV